MAAGVGLREAQAQKLRYLRVVQLHLARFASQSHMVVGHGRDCVQNVVFDFAAGSAATQQFNTNPDQHVLRRAKLPAFTGAADETIFGRAKCSVQRRVQAHPPAVAQNQVMPRRAFEAKALASLRDGSPQWYVEAATARDQRAVPVEEVDFASAAPGQHEPIAPRKLVQETTFTQAVFDFGAAPLVKQSAKLVSVARQ